MEDVWLEALAKPFVVPAMDCRDVLGFEEKVGGPMDVRGALVAVVDVLFAVGGAILRDVELLDEVLDPSCFVGDLLGDFHI